MENKINIAELLKYCPKGMELDCTMFDNVTFVGVDNNKRQFPIEIVVGGLHTKYLTKEGCYHDNTLISEAKCVIFPKGKTTWEGFQRPIKDGDVIVDTLGGIHIMQNSTMSYCYFDRLGILDKTKTTCVRVERLATEKEKEKLFQAIKDDGYKWNPETKTLEKLIKLRFHEGQWITKGYVGGQITSIDYNYSCYRIADFMGGIDTSIPFTLQDNYHLWTIQDAEDGDVLAAHECLVLFKKLDGLNVKCYCTYHFMNNSSFYVDTLQNKDAFHPATKEEKQKLFDAIKAEGYHWNAETKTLEKLPKFKVGDIIRHKSNNEIYCKLGEYSEDFSAYYTDVGFLLTLNGLEHWELRPNKFDVTTLIPFESRVLVRNVNGDLWKPAIYGFSHSNGCYVVGGVYWGQCIPYDVNKELLGTTNNPEDYGSR